MTPEREMEIRAYYAHEGEPPVSFYRPKEAGSAARYDMAEVLAALDGEREKAARLERERDELKARLDEREDDMHARIRAEYDRTIADTWRAANARMADERDEFAARLAALRAEVRDVLAEPHAYIGDRERLVLTSAVDAASSPDVEAYTRRVQTEECELAIRIVAARKTSEIITGERAAAMDVGGKTPLRALVADCSAGALADVEDALRARARELRGGR